MILAEIREYLQTHQRAALSDMSNRFNTDPDALRGMLNKWVLKGKVVKLPVGSSCDSGCCKCDATKLEIYEWCG